MSIIEDSVEYKNEIPQRFKGGDKSLVHIGDSSSDTKNYFIVFDSIKKSIYTIQKGRNVVAGEFLMKILQSFVISSGFDSKNMKESSKNMYRHAEGQLTEDLWFSINCAMEDGIIVDSDWI